MSSTAASEPASNTPDTRGPARRVRTRAVAGELGRTPARSGLAK
jgi:hypothetical protein